MEDPSTVSVRGKLLRCPHCDGGKFHFRRAPIKPTILSILDLDWENRGADVYVCATCGRLDWFLGGFGGDDQLIRETDYLACDAVIPSGAAECPACGWSYQEEPTKANKPQHPTA